MTKLFDIKGKKAIVTGGTCLRPAPPSSYRGRDRRDTQDFKRGKSGVKKYTATR